jgi:hypothetical protein
MMMLTLGRPVARPIKQDWHFADWPELQELGTRGLVAEIDELGLKHGAELVEGDEDFLAVGRQRMEMELKRHGTILILK